MLLLGAAALWDADRRWNERFVSAAHGFAQVKTADGKLQNGRRIVVQSTLDCPIDRAWALAKRSATMVEVAHPLLGFTTRDGRPLPDEWHAGDKVSLRLLGLGVVPLGRHDIEIVRVDDDKHEMMTRETGQLVAVWQHVLRFEAQGDSRTLYTDEVTLAAGPLNPFVGSLAFLLFRYRQTRWQKLTCPAV